jgi:hypothetical protein
MLRSLVLAVSILLIVIGLWPCLQGATASLPPLIWGVVLSVATLLERWRYRANAKLDGTGWEALDERFIDPESGKLMQVFYQQSTGERRYEPVAGDVE